MNNRPHHDDEWYDEIRITTVQRYKTSGLSGDEWRRSAVVFMRKGIVLAEKRLSDIATATRWLAWGWVDDFGPASKGRTDDFPKDLCDQPGCPEEAVTVYRIKTLYNRDGTLAEHQADDQTLQFCARHAERGDFDREDCDDNYEVLSGPGPLGARQEPEDVSEAVNLGAVYLTDGEAGNGPG